MKNLISSINAYSDILLNAFKLHDVSPSQIVTEGEQRLHYQRSRSFTDELPFIEYLPDQKMFLMEDCRSVAAGIEFRTVNTEGFPIPSLADIRDRIMRLLESCIPTYEENPWTIQIYFTNTYNLENTINKIVNFNKSVDDDNLKRVFNELYDVHLSGLSTNKGIFVDTQVTNLPFSGKETTGRIFLYRKSDRPTKNNKKKHSPESELSGVRDKLFSQLKKLVSGGVDVKNIDGRAYYDWMFTWFNTNPSTCNGNVQDALKKYPYPGDHDVPHGRDFSALFTLSSPCSDIDNGAWLFDKQPQKYCSVENVRHAPKIGALTSPRNGAALFDSLPSGSTFCITVVMLDKEVTRRQIIKIRQKAVGDGAEADAAIEEANIAEHALIRNNGIYPVEMGFYIKGKDFSDLIENRNTVSEIAGEAGLQIISDDYDLLACDSFLRNLPGNYSWKKDNTRNRTIKLTLQHIANLIPINGRGRGTGTPVQIALNRGGEPMCYCTLTDRIANSHKIIIGSTGAGKSAKLVEEALSYSAQHNARLIIIEKGESFKGMVQYLSDKGKSVHTVKLAKGNNAIIPPYANAYKALVEEEKLESLINKSTSTMDDLESDVVSDDDDQDEKDYLGEMELLTRIIVTGGDAERNKQLSISDQAIIRRAIINAAITCRDRNDPHPLPQDVASEMKKMVDGNTLRDKQKDTLSDFFEAMNFFCTGLAGELFNRHGSLWPESDIMHIDLGDVTRDGKQAELAVAYASILNNINDIAERDQYSGRPIIVITDEGHNIVSKTSKASPILVPAAVKIVKMWRKLNAWYWIATQNIGDFSDEAAALLKLCEWWEVLTVEPGEDEEIAKFKKLTDEQKSILSSVTKEDKKFAEGFVMCRNKRLNNQLFRSVPPSLVLTLGWTDPNEKAYIKKVANQHNVSNNDAIEIIADELNKKRGIVP